MFRLQMHCLLQIAITSALYFIKLSNSRRGPILLYHVMEFKVVDRADHNKKVLKIRKHDELIFIKLSSCGEINFTNVSRG